MAQSDSARAFERGQTERVLNARTRQVETLDRLARQFGQSLNAAFERNLNAGRQLDGLLGTLASRLSSLAVKAAVSPLREGVERLVDGLVSARGEASAGLFARGGVIEAGRVRPFAHGGVVAAPTYFPMRGGLGLMGESGPEAILPLRRGGDGRLGVSAAAGPRPVTVNVTIATRDAESFRRSETQVAAALARAVARGQRAL